MEAHDALVHWARISGAALHPSVEIHHFPTTGFSFRVRPGACPLNGGDTIVTCPMSLTLSYLNASTICPPSFHTDPDAHFPAVFLSETPRHVVGRFFLIKQYLLGKDSFWWPYIRTLPQPDQVSSWSLPPTWPAEDVELLEGTNVHASITKIKEMLRKEYKAARGLLEGWDNWRDYTKVMYHWAYAIFTSRSFTPSLVIPNSSSIQLPAGCSIDDFSILLPLFDIGNHSITAQTAWERLSDDSCALITYDAYRPGEQVFNNYGLKSNSHLLLSYGFMIPETEKLHNDYNHVRIQPQSSDNGGIEGEEFLLSLRPMQHPSSLLGRSLQINEGTNTPSVLPSFSHVQGMLIWTLVVSQVGIDRLEILLPADSQLDAPSLFSYRARRVLSGDVPPAIRPVLDTTAAIIQDRAIRELEVLGETEAELDEENLTRNQQLARQYRHQCRQLFVNMLESIGSCIESGGEDET